MTDTKNANTGIVYVNIRRFNAADNALDPSPNPAAVGHRLRFQFIDKSNAFIPPGNFNATNWLEQVHGFNAAGT
ncbi:MAG: DUF5007 domain-containing protein, partial [Sphingobacteriaceae bacterium]